MEKWIEYRMGELVDLSQGQVINAQTNHLVVSEGLPLLRITDMLNNTKSVFINAEKVAKKNIAKPEDIIYTRTGQVGLVFRNQFGVVHNNSFKVIPKDERLDRGFLFWFLKSNAIYDYVNGVASGSAQPDLPHGSFKSITISIPSIPTQRRIASILSAYDDLIEVNNRRIKLLEETARELYKEWFVRMRFPGHKEAKFVKGVPKDWNIKPIGKVIDYYIGGGWGNDIQDNQFATSGYVIRGTDIPGVRIGKANREVYRFHKTSNMKSRELIEGDIVFETAGGSEGQPLGRTCYITQELLDSYGDKVMAASFCKQLRTTSIPPLYLYYFLNYLYDTGMIEAFQVQSTGISNYQFEPFLKYQEIILPNDHLMQQFHDKTLIIQKQIALLGEQNTQLRQIRDRLLPRLISGKLEVKEKI